MVDRDEVDTDKVVVSCNPRMVIIQVPHRIDRPGKRPQGTVASALPYSHQLWTTK